MGWYVAKTGNHQRIIVEEITGRNIAVSYEEKDAHLIAAAPDLLEALKTLLALTPTIGHTIIEGSPIDLARKAIARAEGKD